MIRPANPVDDVAPSAVTITDYDRRHLLTYARLLDEAQSGVGWHRTATASLMASGDWPKTRRCYLTHLARAQWIYGILDWSKALEPVAVQ
jgi:hypothetical protein